MYVNNSGTGYANANIFYLFLGAQQQWGENVGGGGQTVSLPISFEVAFTAVVSAVYQQMAIQLVSERKGVVLKRMRVYT